MTNPMTVSRKFDPTVYGLQKNQQNLLVLLCIPILLIFTVGMYVIGIDLAVKLACFIAGCEFAFFLWIGSSPSNLYHFECTCRFFKSIYKGADYIEKYGYNGLQKARSLTHIKTIHDGKYIEYSYSKERPHNWATMLKLHSFQPEDLEMFTESLERMLIGNPDKTLIKTFLHVRSDLTDYSEPIRKELHKNRIPQIVRDSMYEFQVMCETADAKSFENHMIVFLEYTANPEKAKNKLDIIVNNVQEILTHMEIGSEILDTEDKILGMFHGHITYGIHQGA